MFGYNHRWIRPLLAAVWVAALAACGVTDSPAPPPPVVGAATIGPAGGSVEGPDGVRLDVPAGALAGDVTFRIARDAGSSPPLPGGTEVVGHVYEITPHGEDFGAGAAVRLPVDVAAVGDRLAFLMKASPGGSWQVLGPVERGQGVAHAAIASLSYLAVGVCSPNPGGIAQSNVFFEVCPASSSLRWELLDGSGIALPIPQPPNGHPQPVLLITQPTTLTLRLSWTRPNGLNRLDELDTGTGRDGPLVLRTPGFTWGSGAPRAEQVNGSVVRTFTVAVDPAGVAGAGGPNGAVRNLWAQARYRFQPPPPLARVDWSYDAFIPIRVRYLGVQPMPTISAPPANTGVVEGQPATFNVVATISPAAPLAYQWFRRPDANAAFTPIAGATQPSYTLTPATLADNGAQFQVEVCVQGTTRCVSSVPATLTVTRASVVPSFTMQPANLSVSAGQTASFTAVATGVPAPSIRWQTAAAGSATFTDLTTTACPPTPAAASGDSTTATCTVGPVTIGENGRRYRALAINAVAAPGVPSNEATLTVTPAPAAPTITTQPTPQSTAVGGSASFTVVATGTAPLAYAWRLNGTALPGAGAFTVGACTGTVGASGATLTITGLSAGCDGATVTVVVSNGINPDATSNPATLTVTPAGGPGLALLAGAIGGPGTVDGAGSEARVQFGPNVGIAIDGAGTAYFSDSIAGRLRKVTAAGVVTTFPDALLAPAGVAVDASGNAYVAERARHRILRFASDGTVSVWAGSGVQGTLDGTGTQARLSNPQFLAIDGTGNLFVVEDAGSTPRIRRISAAQEVTTFHLFGSGGGVAAIAAGADGSVYGLGTGALSNTVQRIAPGGVVSLVAGGAGQEGNVDGSGASARFNSPSGLAFGADGHLYVTDSNNRTVRRVTTAGAVTTVSGAAVLPVVPADGTGSAGRYEFPTAIGRAPNGDLLVGDVSTMRRLTPSFVLTTFVGQRLVTGTADGSGAAARFRVPLGVALDASGNAYVADLDRIRLVTAAGEVTTRVSQQPARLIVRDGGSGFVVASDNAVWRMTAAGVATLLAGNPQEFDYVDAPVGTHARFGAIRGIAVDGGGAVFVAETINGNATIRRISPAGEVTTWAGAKDAPPEIVDGDRLNARFGSLAGGLAFDASGNLIVADVSPFTGAALLRRITPQGTVSTFVNGGALRQALVLALAPDGSLLSGGDATLQRISASGAVTTLVGTPSLRGVRLGASPNLNIVSGLAVRPNGQVVLTSEAAVLELTRP